MDNGVKLVSAVFRGNKMFLSLVIVARINI